ncbi:hypothetical protein PQU96_08000 [Vogesella sp. LYT5W]|uniref:Uncharacterized protein n=1 Tax=Vogesella margarita TaxID=2984199 RepID=A0ABT5IND1_9NEIS|nr:hypothetical protein [Vogesella margarita]MDC7714071.1 hypothetical protein [Vogesella margarita]
MNTFQAGGHNRRCRAAAPVFLGVWPVFWGGDVDSAAMRLAVAGLISQKVMKKSIYIVFGF